APAFMLFAVVPVSPEVTFFGMRMQLQVARVDWGMLYVFALASIAVFGTALAGWTSNNKLALLGGLRASAQLVSYEVTLGLTLVGAFIVFGSLRLDTMALPQSTLATCSCIRMPKNVTSGLTGTTANSMKAGANASSGEIEEEAVGHRSFGDEVL